MPASPVFDHGHGYFRVRRGVPALLVWLAVRVGLSRLVIESGTEPHHPECTETVAVLEARR